MRIHERVLNTIESNAQLRRDGKYIAIPWLSLPKLSKVMPGIQQGRYYLVSANSKIGKCFQKGTEIRMFNGTLKKVEDIQSEDLLMGPDSLPRKVLETTTGRDQMFKISQSYGEPYIVNSNHILALIDYKTKIFYNLSISEYFNTGYTLRYRLRGYKTAIEYPNNLLYNPYLLGLWLGDGDSAGTGMTAFDPEIQKYIHSLESNNTLLIKDLPHNRFLISQKTRLGVLDINGKIIREFTTTIEAANFTGIKRCEYISRATKSGKLIGGYYWKWIVDKNEFLTVLRKYNLIKNKYIPNDYLITTKENRLQLLAGLIDSDGYYCNNAGYEIITTRPVLADGIVELANSLGFYASYVKKIATMKREDNSIYSVEVSRIKIRGKYLHTIPCILSRKQAEIKTSSKNFLSTIKVESIGEDDYYGFSLENNRLFLLKDYTVAHNTQLTDYLFMYEPLAWAKSHPTANLKPKIFYFSLEMSKEDKILAAMAHYIHKKNGKIYTPEKLLSVYHNEFLTPEDIENVKLIKPELDFLEDHVFFIDRTRNPYGIYKTMKDYAESHGTYTKKWVNWMNNETKQIEKREIIDFYTPDNPDEIVIVLIDHISLFTPENGMTLHESISKFSSDYAIAMRDHWKYCPVIVQQQAAASESQQFTQSGQQIINKLKPSTDGLGDNKLTQRDVDIMFSLFAPHRYNIDTYHDYDLHRLGDNYREFIINLNRRGSGNLSDDLFFNGAVNVFKELPKANSPEMNGVYDYVRKIRNI